MKEWFLNQSPVIQALLATLFTWFLTALGSATVFIFKGAKKKLLNWMLGFAAGVMIAASYWSLLAPAIEMSKGKSLPVWFPPTVGFLVGAFFLRFIDRILPHLHLNKPIEKAEGPKTSLRRSMLLVLAITMHNIPEGLAVGVAFGAAALGLPFATLGAAVALAIGIGLQNFPEGIAVSMPLRREGMSRLKSFWYGQLTGIVEPMAGVLGAFIVLGSQAMLPYALSFAAGAMIFVTVEELIPESQNCEHSDLATMGTIIGFVVMMVLDVGLS